MFAAPRRNGGHRAAVTARRRNDRHQRRGQCERSEKIGAELRLETVAEWSVASRRNADTGVVDEQIQTQFPIDEGRRRRERTRGSPDPESPDARETCGSWRRIRSAASRPLASLRAARITSLPARASSSAVYQPMPLLAPVTTDSVPASDGISAGVHFPMLPAE